MAATAYFDLVLRSVTEPGLLKTLVKFLLDDNYDGTRLLDVLVQRLDSEDRVRGKELDIGFLWTQ